VAIDAEGYDAEILEQIDIKHGPPQIILYEHALLARGVRKRCEQLLASSGFSIRHVNQNDTLAASIGLPQF
jgi:hypothetical protein